MAGENLDVVYVYEERADDRLQAVRDGLQYRDRHSVAHGDVEGLLRRYGGDEGGWGDPDLPRIELNVQEHRLQQDTDAFEQSYVQRLEAFFEVVRDVYFAGDERPWFAYGVNYHTAEAIADIRTAPVDAASLAENRINYAVWLNVFPPSLVETYGRETLLSAPAWRTEEWDDGAVLVVAYEDPLSLAPVTELNEHLGLDSHGL